MNSLTQQTEKIRVSSSQARWRGYGRSPSLVAGTAIAALLVVVALAVTFGTSYSVFVVDTCLLACIGALALSLLMGTAGQVSVGNSAFLGAGSFTAAWATTQNLGILTSVLLAIFVCSALGAIVGLPALRISGVYLMLATLAAYFVVLFVATQYQSQTVGSGSFQIPPLFRGLPSSQNRSWAWLLIVIVAGCIVLVAWLRSGRSGRAWRMIRDHELAASLMGIPVGRYKLLAFVISSGLIGLQGSLAAYFQGSVSYEGITIAVAVSYIAMIIVGGSDSLVGPLIGAFLISILPLLVPSLLSGIVGESLATSSSAFISLIIYGLLIIVFIIFAPRGITGWVNDASSAIALAIKKSRSISPS